MDARDSLRLGGLVLLAVGCRGVDTDAAYDAGCDAGLEHGAEAAQQDAATCSGGEGAAGNFDVGDLDEAYAWCDDAGGLTFRSADGEDPCYQAWSNGYIWCNQTGYLDVYDDLAAEAGCE